MRQLHTDNDGIGDLFPPDQKLVAAALRHHFATLFLSGHGKYNFSKNCALQTVQLRE
jgi:hypothetical protein